MKNSPQQVQTQTCTLNSNGLIIIGSWDLGILNILYTRIEYTRIFPEWRPV